jgi:DNA-binding response OmpR family regulator
MASRATVVLIVEDEPLIRWMLADVLVTEGFGVLEAKNGAEAMERFDAEVDIVLLDIRLPDASGLDLLPRFLRQRPHVAVLAMTGHGTPDVERVALERGARAVVHKPFEVDELVAMLRALEPTDRGAFVQPAPP